MNTTTFDAGYIFYSGKQEIEKVRDEIKKQWI
jgi:hypothetical protein